MRKKAGVADPYQASTWFSADEIATIRDAGSRLHVDRSDPLAAETLERYRIPVHYVTIFGAQHTAEQTADWALRLATTVARRDDRYHQRGEIAPGDLQRSRR